MPDGHEPLYIVNDPSDVNIAKTFAALKSAKYWLTSSLIYAQVKSVSEWKEGETSRKIVVSPKLTLSGTFDAGKNPEISVVVPHSLFTYQPPPNAGTKTLIVLNHAGDSYTVLSESADFMPGERHCPICSVWDFADQRVSDTLNAVQESRKIEKAADSTTAKP